MKRLFLDALTCSNKSGKIPLWLMRQAGRYLVEYQVLRKKYAFLELCQTPELIVEVTKMPIDIFDFDAAIVFSDILLIAEELGFTLTFEEGAGPHLTPTLDGPKDVQRLQGHILEPQNYLTHAIRLLKKELNVPLIGFAGAPFTLASYLIEGKSSKNYRKTKKWLLQDPESFHALLELLSSYTIEHLNRQIDAGVDAVQIFDSWAHILACSEFLEFSVRYLEKILRGIKPCPVIVFCKGIGAFYPEITPIQPACISFDTQANLPRMRKEIGSSIAIQGNIDPDILLTDPQTVRRHVQKHLDVMKDDPGFILNLGHGILPQSTRENVQALVDCCKGM